MRCCCAIKSYLPSVTVDHLCIVHICQVNLLSDVKDASNVEKEGLIQVLESRMIELSEAISEKEAMGEKVSALKKKLVASREEQSSVVKDKAVLLSRVIFLGEQRSDLMLRVDEMDRRTNEQAATIAGTLAEE